MLLPWCSMVSCDTRVPWPSTGNGRECSSLKSALRSGCSGKRWVTVWLHIKRGKKGELLFPVQPTTGCEWFRVRCFVPGSDQGHDKSFVGWFVTMARRWVSCALNPSASGRYLIRKCEKTHAYHDVGTLAVGCSGIAFTQCLLAKQSGRYTRHTDQRRRSTGGNAACYLRPRLAPGDRHARACEP